MHSRYFTQQVLDRIRSSVHRIATDRRVDPDELAQEVNLVLFGKQFAPKRKKGQTRENLLAAFAYGIALKKVRELERKNRRWARFGANQLDADIAGRVDYEIVALEAASASDYFDKLHEGIEDYIARKKAVWNVMYRSDLKDLWRYDRRDGLPGMKQLCHTATLYGALAIRPPERLAIPVMSMCLGYSSAEIAEARNKSVDAVDQVCSRFRTEVEAQAEMMFIRHSKG